MKGKYDLSILVPSRNEMFLKNTVDDILKNIEGKTEVIVVLDGAWSDPPIDDDKRVTIVRLPETIGQRAATNLACQLSKAKYVMKVDAHCSFDKGFDRILMEDMQDDWTIVPVMRNLHAFDWLCPDGHRRYQGPMGPCEECGKETTRDMKWFGKPSPQSTSYHVNDQLEFCYFNEYKAKQKGDLVETMSLQGSCFMTTRENYWERELCDASWGSWGGQGAEVALKTWLSGGSVICDKRTWYAHLFRTQGKDFGFPYSNPGNEQKRAKDKLRDTFHNNKWHKQTRNLEWLVEKFWPVPGWEENYIAKLKGETLKGLLYYTDNQLKVSTAKKCQRQLKSIGLPITSVSLKPMEGFGHNIHIEAERGYLTMFKQILAGLEAMEEDIIFMCEHDCLYHPSHFDFTPPKKDKFYYNQNWWKVREDGFAVHWDANQVSGLCAYREHLVNHYRDRLTHVNQQGFNRSYEPGGRDKTKYEVWNSEVPYIDIRHKGTLTGNKWRGLKDFRDKSGCVNWQESTIKDIPGWNDLVLY